MDLGIQFLKIKRLIVHRIIERILSQPCATVISESKIINLNSKAEEILFKRIISAAGKESNAFIMGIKETSNGTFFDYATKLNKANEKDFIKISIDIAELLAENQIRMGLSGAYLLVIDGYNDLTKKSITIVIKAELQEALKHSNENDQSVIEVLEKVFLSPAQKLFKIGVIIENDIDVLDDKIDVKNYTGLLFDSQFRADLTPAAYFYKDFLGFSIDENDKIQTKLFYDKTDEFIKDNIKDYTEKSQQLNYLKNYFLVDKESLLQPSQFAKKLFTDTNILDKFTIDVVNELPSTFSKDIVLIKAKLEKRSIRFKNNITISGPEQKFNDSVTVVTDLSDLSQNDIKSTTYTILKIAGKPYHNE